MKKSNARVATRRTAPATPKPIADEHILTPELIAALRSAGTVEAALTLIAPRATPKPKVDTVYTVAEECMTPLPGRRGACLKVIAVAVRLNAPFRISDITKALPTVKSAAYFVRKLYKSGHLIEASA